jgi:hypothetical protein
MSHIALAALATALAFLIAPQASWAQDQSDELVVKPSCPIKNFEYKAEPKRCEFAPVKAIANAAECTAIQGTWDKGACKPPAAPEPVCATPLGSRIRYKDGQCVYDASTPVSDSSRYKGDCFKVVSKIAGAPVAERLYVVDQSADGSSLHVLPAERPFILCSPISDPNQSSVAVSTQDVLRSGARRSGWVYGTLLLPYKYRPGDQTSQNNVTVGPYLGARVDTGGVGWTYAVSAGLTQTKVTSVDADNKPNETNVSGFTLAVGLLFDVNKSIKPFKTGVFIGADRYSKLKGEKVQGSGKLWIALQIGYDFTE